VTVSQQPAVVSFVDVATRYCTLIERAAPLTSAELLAEVERLLPALYSTVLALPDVEPTDDQCQTERIPHEEWRVIHDQLREVLGARDEYREIYDPVAVSDPAGAIERGDEPVLVSLADDLADIWRELRAGLNTWSQADEMHRANILFEWRSMFSGHSGQHLVDALRVIHWWRHVHHVGEPDEAPEA